MRNNRNNTLIYRYICLFIILLGFALRIHNLDARSLWFDEAMEYWVATSPLPDLLPTVKTAIQDPPLYSLLLHFWLKAGHTEFYVRFLSLIFSLLGILGVITLSRLSFGRKTSLIAGTLAAVSAPDIRFAQEAGQYALMVFALTWYLTFLYLLMRQNRWPWAMLGSVFGLVAIYSYYGTILTISATILVCSLYVVAKREKDKLLKLLTLGIVCLFLALPLMVKWLPDQLFRGPTANALQLIIGTYQEELWQLSTQLQNLSVFQVIGHQPDGWPWPTLRAWIIWLPLLFLILVGVIRYKFRLPALWLTGSLLLYYLVSRLGAYPFGGRYSLILSPLLWICVAAGIAGLFSRRKVWLWRNVLALSFLGWFVLIAILAPVEPQEDLRSVAQQWLSWRPPGETTYVYYGAVPGFRYQLNLLNASETAPALWYRQCWQDKTMPYCADDNIFYGRWIRHLPPEQKKEAIFADMGGFPEQFWLVFSHTTPEETNDVLLTLADTYVVTKRYLAENSALYLLEQR